MRMGGGRSEGANPGPLPPQGSADSGLFGANALSSHYPNLLRTEQLSGTTFSQNILESTFSVETQKICGVDGGLVGDYCFALIRTKALSVGKLVRTIAKPA